MKVEHYFLRYAFPCMGNLVQKGKLSEDKYKELELKLLNNQDLDRNELERIFPNAFKRLKEVAANIGAKDYWNYKVLKQYFLEEHNNYIMLGKDEYSNIPDSLKELCKVYKAKVVDIGPKKEILTVKYNNTKRKVLAKLVPNVKIGDKVTVHQGYAIEIL